MKEINTTDLLGLNFYQVTGVETAATFKEIKKSYLRFLKQKKQVENPSEKTQKLWEQTEIAYSILGNEYSKALYDLFGVDFLNLTDFKTIGYQSDETIEALNKMMGKAPPEIAEYGGMSYFPIEFELKDFFTGSKKTVRASHVQECECPTNKPNCLECKKEPFYDKYEEYEIILPKGAYEFYRLIGKAIGDTAALRGASDVVFVATSLPHPVFERKGRDLYTTINLTLSDVLNCNNKIIEGLDGSKIEIPVEGAQNNMQRRIIGAGMPDFFNKKERGDLIVTFNLTIPKLTNNQKDKVLEILKESNNNQEL